MKMHEVATEVSDRCVSADLLVKTFFIIITHLQCRLDLVAVSYAYVYFEKLVLMVSAIEVSTPRRMLSYLSLACVQGKVHKSFRKSVAGVCLLLAAKFILDLKKQEISDLINVS